MSAWENVAVPLFYARQTVTKPQAMAALERVGLADRANHQPNELSGGERQRVAIARAMVNKPRLIMADEPTGNLDSRTGAQIMQIFHELHKSGATIILVTHEAHIAERAQRIVTMRDGKVLSDRAGSGVAPTESAADTDVDEAPQAFVTPAEEPTPPPATGPVLHPDARKSLIWALTGPSSVVAFMIWSQLVKVLVKVNPGLFRPIAPLVGLIMFGVALVAPFLGFFAGRRGARWVKLAPARFTGLRRARVAQWVSGIFLVLFLGLICLSIVGYLILRAQGGLPRG
jgi:energy-coupling factor transporter ATP-binding protein EcfA2